MRQLAVKSLQSAGFLLNFLINISNFTNPERKRAVAGNLYVAVWDVTALPVIYQCASTVDLTSVWLPV